MRAQSLLSWVCFRLPLSTLHPRPSGQRRAGGGGVSGKSEVHDDTEGSGLRLMEGEMLSPAEGLFGGKEGYAFSFSLPLCCIGEPFLD